MSSVQPILSENVPEIDTYLISLYVGKRGLVSMKLAASLH